MQNQYTTDLERVLAEIKELRHDLSHWYQVNAPGYSEPTPTWEIKSFYTYKEVAAVLGLSYRKVQYMVSHGDLLTINIGGPRVPHSELMRVWTKGLSKP